MFRIGFRFLRYVSHTHSLDALDYDSKTVLFGVWIPGFSVESLVHWGMSHTHTYAQSRRIRLRWQKQR